MTELFGRPVEDERESRKTSIFRHAWIAAMVLVCGAALWLLHIESRRPGGDSKNPYEYTIDEVYKKTDPVYLSYQEVGKIIVNARQLHGLAVGPQDRIYVTGDRNLFVLDGAGSIILGEPANCVAVGEDGKVYLGMKDHVEARGNDLSEKARWRSLGDRAFITSIAVAADEVFVADAGNRVVWRFDKTGNLRLRCESDPEVISGFIVPSEYFDVALAPNGELWVVNPGRQRVENYSYEGQLKSAWGKAAMAIDGFCGCCNPSHMAILPDGMFVTSEKGLPRVKVYSASGEFRCVVAGVEHFAEGTVGLDLAADSRGRVLVLDPAMRAVRIFTKKEVR